MSTSKIWWAGLLLCVLFSGATRADTNFKVTLLGTGTPNPGPARFGPATLVEVGGEKLLFDCGRGATIRLWQLHIPLSAVTILFLTHLHSDHVVGIPDLWLTGWLATPYGNRMSPFRVLGPQGTRSMMKNLQLAYAWDIRVRPRDENRSAAGVAVAAEDIREGVVLERNGVKVTAFNVDHGAVLRPALGFRVDYNGHSVVISGDTRPSDNLIGFSKGCDVLIHEVAQAKPELLRESDAARRIIGHHTTPEEAGRIFSKVKPKLAVYSHISLLTMGSGVAAPTMEELVAATRTTYTGPLEVGDDLMTVDIGRTVSVRRFARSGN